MNLARIAPLPVGCTVLLVGCTVLLVGCAVLVVGCAGPSRMPEPTPPQVLPGGPGGEGPLSPTTLPQPSRHLTPDEVRKLHARQHAEAAADLRRFEEAECRGIAPDVRGACPSVQIGTAVVIASGVRLPVRPGHSATATLALIRCHLAFAAARGWHDVDTCAFYLKGVQAHLAPSGDAIELTSDDPAVVEELKSLATFPPPTGGA